LNIFKYFVIFPYRSFLTFNKMSDCVTFFIEKNPNLLLGYAFKRSGGNWQIAEDSVSFVNVKSHEADVFCKIYNRWWPFNQIKEFIKKEWKRKRKEVDKPLILDFVDHNQNVEKDFITKDYLIFITREFSAFVRKKYPRAHTKYMFYFQIWRSHKLSGRSIEDIQADFPDTNMKEVESRCSAMISEFIKYLKKKKFR